MTGRTYGYSRFNDRFRYVAKCVEHTRRTEWASMIQRPHVLSVMVVIMSIRFIPAGEEHLVKGFPLSHEYNDQVWSRHVIYVQVIMFDLFLGGVLGFGMIKNIIKLYLFVGVMLDTDVHWFSTCPVRPYGAVL